MMGSGSEIKQITRGAMIASAGLLVSQYLLSPLVGIMNTRILGAQQYGLFSLASGVVAIFSMFPLMGMHEGIIKFLPVYLRDHELSKAKALFLFAMRLLTVVSLLCTGICLLTSGFVSDVIFNEPQMKVILYSVAVVVLLNNYQFLFASLFAALRDITCRTLVKYVFPNVTKLVVLVVVFVTDAGLPGVIGAVLASSFVQVGMGFVYGRRLFPVLYDTSVQASLTGQEKKSFVAYSLPLYLTMFVDVFFQQTDGLMIGYFRDAWHVGVYEVAFRVTPFILLPLGAMSQVFQPILSVNFAGGDMQKIADLYRGVTKIVVTLTAPILISVLVFPSELLSVFGEEFRSGAACLVILSIGFFFQAGTGHTSALLALSGRPRWLLINNSVAMVVNAALNYFLIQAWGIIGAAVATAITLMASNLVQLLMVYRLFGFQPYTVSYWRVLVSAVAAAGVLVGIQGFQWILGPWTFLIFICIGISIYFMALWQLGLDEREMELVRALGKKLKQAFGLSSK